MQQLTPAFDNLSVSSGFQPNIDVGIQKLQQIKRNLISQNNAARTTLSSDIQSAINIICAPEVFDHLKKLPKEIIRGKLDPSLELMVNAIEKFEKISGEIDRGIVDDIFEAMVNVKTAGAEFYLKMEFLSGEIARIQALIDKRSEQDLQECIAHIIDNNIAAAGSKFSYISDELKLKAILKFIELHDSRRVKCEDIVVICRGLNKISNSIYEGSELLNKFIRHVFNSEYDKVDLLMKLAPDLALVPCNLNFLDKQFTYMSGFVYAIWSIDIDMLNLMNNYLNDRKATEEKKLQMQQLVNGTTISSWNPSPLIDALNRYQGSINAIFSSISSSLRAGERPNGCITIQRTQRGGGVSRGVFLTCNSYSDTSQLGSNSNEESSSKLWVELVQPFTNLLPKYVLKKLTNESYCGKLGCAGGYTVDGDNLRAIAGLRERTRYSGSSTRATYYYNGTNAEDALDEELDKISICWKRAERASRALTSLKSNNVRHIKEYFQRLLGQEFSICSSDSVASVPKLKSSDSEWKPRYSYQ